jgi:anti-sigma regulatory factor (Ser/Thr protein kinase)
LREIALHIMDIMQNSAAAKASMIRVSLAADPQAGTLTAMIEDNGCGMDSELLETVTDPFSTTRTTRRVGLGIPLLKASCERSGGSFDIASVKGKGTTVTAVFAADHIDRPVLGDLAGVITDMAASMPEADIQLRLECGERQFGFSSAEAARMLGDVPLSEFSVVKWLREYINEGIIEIFGGVLSEIVG